ncbi:unnamed protein product [Oppiella nova]|uniref:Caspase family p20 domain-containing protein n=1 Tax=Oppiella nova TaxID=334625 RepID=A0A7R9LHS6_9ACAR|nr:unnamed protein product [Oppiella nova]CAG2163796.1 unnamed protein product [Oppiella nova]
MDKSEVRNIFMQNINEFLSQVQLNAMFMKLLEKHTCAKQLLASLNEIPADNEYAKKFFIFTEFNRDREACNELVEILIKCEQGVAAEALKGYNQSSTAAITYSTEVKLVVKDAQTLRSGASRHGYDDMIQGSGQGQDVIPIKTIVEQFSDRNCHSTLRQKPKIFVFNCCRNKQNSAPDNRQNSIERDWMDDTTRTYICYSCAEGIQAFYTDSGYTLFGQAFSHCIAEHACDFSLTQLFYKTCDQLQRAEVQQRPEMYTKNMDRDLYFNPGLYKER